jgi:beta-aspartyl-peptidase (threonine type)
MAQTLGAGAVACVKRLRNPVLAARAVLERSEHVLFAAEGAEAFAEAQGLELVGPDYYFTQARHDQWLRAQASTGMALLDHDAAALAARAGAADPLDPTTSSARLARWPAMPRQPRRGHVDRRRHQQAGGPRGRYPDRWGRLLRGRRRGGLGHGHRRDVHPHRGRVRRLGANALRGLSLEESARRVVMEKLPAIGGRGGLIAVDRAGNVTLPFNTEGMYRGVARVARRPTSGSTADMAKTVSKQGIVLPPERVVAVDNLTVRFATSERTVEAVRNLSFHVDRGETLAVVGESGSGKSVTSLALMRLVEHGGGKIANGAAALRRRNGEVLDLANAANRRCARCAARTWR